MSKAPSPMSPVIARLRAAGARVAYGYNHNPGGSAQFARLHYVVRHNGDEHVVMDKGHEYQRVILALTSLAASIEQPRRDLVRRAATIRKGDNVQGFGVATSAPYTPRGYRGTRYGDTHVWVDFDETTRIFHNNTHVTITEGARP